MSRRMYSESQLKNLIKEELKADLFEHTIRIFTDEDYGSVNFSFICGSNENLSGLTGSSFIRKLWMMVSTDNTENLSPEFLATGTPGGSSSYSTDHDSTLEPMFVTVSLSKLTVTDKVYTDYQIDDYVGSKTYDVEDTVRRIY